MRWRKRERHTKSQCQERLRMFILAEIEGRNWVYKKKIHILMFLCCIIFKNNIQQKKKEEPKEIFLYTLN